MIIITGLLKVHFWESFKIIGLGQPLAYFAKTDPSEWVLAAYENAIFRQKSYIRVRFGKL